MQMVMVKMVLGGRFEVEGLRSSQGEKTLTKSLSQRRNWRGKTARLAIRGLSMIEPSILVWTNRPPFFTNGPPPISENEIKELVRGRLSRKGR